MTSHCSASAFGLSAHTAPAARWRSAAARRMSWTTSSCPAFCKLAAMLAPIVPSPMKPTFMCLSRIQKPLSRTVGEGARGRSRRRVSVSVTKALTLPALRAGPVPLPRCGRGLCSLPRREHVLGDLGRGHCRWPAGVKGEMRDDLADLLLGDTVVEGAVEVAGQLPLAAERDQRRDDDQAAVALLQAGTLPDLAEQHLLAVIDQVGNDVADRVARRICLRLGHGFLRWGLGD